ncbi:MAG TPA: hypothetical protein VNI55_00360 [Gaiellaceae bacterium]|nr:hypothetical protein [Gaiellaceae bacterium]
MKKALLVVTVVAVSWAGNASADVRQNDVRANDVRANDVRQGVAPNPWKGVSVAPNPWKRTDVRQAKLRPNPWKDIFRAGWTS